MLPTNSKKRRYVGPDVRLAVSIWGTSIFVRDYQTGKLAPEKILSFGKSHGIVINQFAIEKFHLESNK